MKCVRLPLTYSLPDRYSKATPALGSGSGEAYAEYRRTGYPRLYAIIESLNKNVAEDEIMRRMTFVSSELSTNSEAVSNAVEMLDGPDESSTWLWWDAKPLSEYPPKLP